MGAFIVKQPNGNYCRFSTVVDCPTHWNMTEDYYIDMCKEKAIRDAEEEAKDVLANHVHPFEWVIENFIPINMNKKEFEAFLKEVGYEGN